MRRKLDGDAPETTAGTLDEEAPEETIAATNEATVEPETQEESPSRVSKRYTKCLKVVLTDEEILKASKRWADRTEDLKRKEAELESLKNQYKGEISRIKSDIDVENNLVRDGFEFRDVEEEETIFYDLNLLYVVRLDTMEKIESRKLYKNEMQRSLPGM